MEERQCFHTAQLTGHNDLGNNKKYVPAVREVPCTLFVNVKPKCRMMHRICTGCDKQLYRSVLLDYLRCVMSSLRSISSPYRNAADTNGSNYSDLLRTIVLGGTLKKYSKFGRSIFYPC